MARPLRHLLLATSEDVSNPKAWSGIPHSLRVALEGQVDRLTVFQPPRPARTSVDVLRRVMFSARNYPLWITKATLQQNARSLRSEIDRVRPDAVLSISSACVAYLGEVGVPVFLFSDAPYQAFSDTYARWDTPPRRIAAFAAEEARAARELDGLCFGSGWACDEAERLYALPSAERLHVIPLGANWVPAISRAEIFARVEERITRLRETAAELELLYLGKDWERKGGPLAVEAARLLHASGQKVRLHVVGCRPELGPAAGPGGFITVHGPLYQSDPLQAAQLAELFFRSHFLIVPTLAECFGIVFAEAQAFALPPVSRRVDAVPSIILDGETGLLFAPDAPAQLYADRMLALCRDPERYRLMAQRARLRFEERLTWNRTAEAVLAAINQALTSRRAQAQP